MRKANHIYYLAGLAAGILTGCSSEFLDRPPQSQIVDANFYQTAEQVLAGTAPLYNLVWFDYNDKASHGIGDARGVFLLPAPISWKISR
ncbi:RagB/SusD family nutrient uptake outer membrane protein [Anseongella ginsenosidimutans]|uniref:RagB/SusD family nutrient uptake outer membrane protein n=1 Tax=Anseongella ginsenosidimutans TaxID=496056 RepID=UPI001CEF865B|nr:RagB/SusD family nutrient uptake outer membrane protein [Anseongella ginsenosidimutans]